MLQSKKLLRCGVGLINKISLQAISSDTASLTANLQHIHGQREDPSGLELLQVHNPATGNHVESHRTSLWLSTLLGAIVFCFVCQSVDLAVCLSVCVACCL